MKKQPSLFKYFLLGIAMFLLAIAVADVARLLLSLLAFSDQQAELVASLMEGAVAAVAAGFVLYQLKMTDLAEKKEADISEAQFLQSYNQGFIQDAALCQVEQLLEQDMKGSRQTAPMITDENRQAFINYLVYLESIAPLVFRDVLRLEHIDDLMAYRFFLAVNNPQLQQDQLFPEADYYRGCFKLYALWKEYRLRKGLPIPQEETSLDNWSQFEKYAREAEVVVRPLLAGDRLNKVAALLYDTDPYIYPALLGGRRRTIKAITVWLQRGNGVFCKQNILVAIKNENIVGALLYVDGRTTDRTAVKKTAGQVYPASFDHVNNNYFAHILDDAKDGVYIACVSVSKRCVGQHVGTTLLSAFLEKYSSRQIGLDVLADNGPAIHLYKKLDFVVTGQCEGYASRPPRPMVLKMLRQPNL